MGVMCRIACLRDMRILLSNRVVLSCQPSAKGDELLTNPRAIFANIYNEALSDMRRWYKNSTVTTVLLNRLMHQE